MITDLLMTGAGLPFTKRNGMMVVKKFADCPQEMDFNSNADNLYHDHKMLGRWLPKAFIKVVCLPSSSSSSVVFDIKKGFYFQVRK